MDDEPSFALKVIRALTFSKEGILTTLAFVKCEMIKCQENWGAAVQMLATRKTNQHIEDFSWNDTKSKPPETMREQCIRNTSD